MSELKAGQKIGAYEILRVLGQGGMGTVYLAEDHSLDRRVALKILPPHFADDPEIVARFQREARALAKVRHPNLMHIYTVGEHEGRPYFAMEYIKGSTLNTILAKAGRIPAEQAAHIAAEVMSALDKVHQAGIVHRDIKAGNIMIDEDGRAVLMDFGLARQAHDAALTGDHTVLGTPNYMSPEQAKGERVDARTDIYSLGIVLYEMLTGAPPFKGKTSFEILRQHIESSVPPPSAVQPGIPAGFDPVVARAVAKSPVDRYQTVREMAADLAAVCPNATLLRLTESPENTTGATVLRAIPFFPSSVRLGRAPGIVRRLLRSRRLVWGGAAAALVIALAVGGWLALRGAPAPWVEIQRKGAAPVRGRLVEITTLDDGTTTAKIEVEGSDRESIITVREGDELNVLPER